MDGMDDRRASILEAVARSPGTSTRAAARSIGVTEWTADYHLRALAKEGIVTREIIGRERCWYKSSCGFCPVIRRAMPVVRRPEALALSLAAEEATHLPLTVLSRRAGVPVGTARWAGEQLVDAFILERGRMGRLALRDGAGLCISRAASGERCELWGKCAVSRAWKEQTSSTQERI